MCLITKEVEIYLSYKNYRHYMALGYPVETFINKQNKLSVRRNKIKVKVDDLHPNSNALVEVCCDSCLQHKFISYAKYFNHNHDGKTYCLHCAGKLFRGGENHPRWNSNRTQDERENERSYPEYLEFIKKVLARDRMVCYCCGKTTKDVDIHHLNGYNWCIEGRTDETNAVTLCENCHANFHLI